MNGVPASKLGVHIEIGFIMVTMFSEYTGVGKGQWPSEWPRPVTGHVLEKEGSCHLLLHIDTRCTEIGGYVSIESAMD